VFNTTFNNISVISCWEVYNGRAIKHLESSIHWWIGSEKNNMILIFSAMSNNFRGESIFINYFDHDQKLEISYM
jgi:hypothetical protein